MRDHLDPLHMANSRIFNNRPLTLTLSVALPLFTATPASNVATKKPLPPIVTLPPNDNSPYSNFEDLYATIAARIITSRMNRYKAARIIEMKRMLQRMFSHTFLLIYKNKYISVK